MRWKIYTFLLSLFFFCNELVDLKAQDPRFSQFYAAPLHLSPAMIGVFQGKVRFTATYRDQYSSILEDKAYRTFAGSFDMRFRTVDKDYVGLGFSLSRDQAGASRFNRTQGNAGLSFMKQLGGSRYSSTDQYLVAGAQIGFEQRGFDSDVLWFSNQFDTEGAFINYNAPSGEGFDENPQQIFLDFNAGLLWYALFDENMSIYAGGALYHISKPAISFQEQGNDRLYRRWVAHAGGELPLGTGMSLLPAAIFMTQGPSTSTTFGGNLRFSNRDWREVKLRAGVWGHLANMREQGIGMESVIFSAVLELERWGIGISYDVTTSTLARANDARGGLEISLIYLQPDKGRHRVNCPVY